MRTIIVVSLLALASACSYSHVGQAIATFNQPAPAAGGLLTLKISRHVDTIVNGPDDEEDQVLVLEVRDFRLNQRLKIPSENVTPEFTATRFGPRSKGEGFSGYLIVRKIASDQVTAYVHLDITARTESGTYTQTAKFHGEHKFFREAGHD